MDELTLQAILAGMQPDQIEAIERAQREATVFRHPDVLPVVDEDGDPLIVGQVYVKKNGNLFRVQRCQFGSGNVMDTYYWVYGIGADLRDDRITVDAKFRRGKPRYYPAPLRKNFQVEHLSDEIQAIIEARRNL